VQRLTGLKFSASVRRGVYRERPTHQQAAWLARIRSERDLEVLLLLALIQENRRPLGGVARVMRLLREPSQWLAFIRRSKGAQIKARQRYKGVQ
jgi:hypothetical protein